MAINLEAILQETRMQRLSLPPPLHPPIPDWRMLAEDDTLRLYQKCDTLMGTTRLWWPLIEPDRAFIDGWHLGCIAEHLEELARPGGCIKNIVINVPPRFAKSVETCVYFFAHVWARRPASRWIYSSFAADNVKRDSLRCRDIVMHPLYRYLWNIHLKDDQNTQTRFTNQHQGFRYGVTVQGQGMGEGAEFIICDDPQNPKQSISPAERAKVIHWWRATMSRRSTDERTMRKAIIMQRLNEGDLTGYLMTEEHAHWDHLVLPMRYEPRRYLFNAGPEKPEDAAPVEPIKAPELIDDVTKLVDAFAVLTGQTAPPPAKDSIRPTALQRIRPHLIDGPEGSGREQPGDLLWPERFPEDVVAKAEIELATEAPGQYQQRPSAEAGDVFLRENIMRWHPLSEAVADDTTGIIRTRLTGVELKGREEGQFRRFGWNQLTWFQCIDTALTEGNRSAYTVCGTFFATPEYDLGLWHIFRARMNVQYQLGALHALRDGPILWNQKKHTITQGPAWPFKVSIQAVEKKASGIGLIQEAAAGGKPFHPLIADKDKVMRATSVAAMYVNGKVFHPEPTRTWVVELEDELASFPNGKFADQVDVVSYGGILTTHDKLLRGLCAGRVMAEAPTPEQELAEQHRRDAESGNVFHFGFGPGAVRVEFPDDDVFGGLLGTR
jgi:predicted phage terminase large subunit-like protein